jgi:FlaA1/EpsC-like NDP-sugar epimerase
MQIFALFANNLSAACRNRWTYRSIICTVQLVLFAVGSIASFLLRFEGSIPREMQRALCWGTLAFVIVKALVFRLYRLDRGLWRYFGIHDTVRIAHANFIASVACGTIVLSTFPPPFPRSVIIIDFLVCLLMSIGVRAGMRLMLEVATAIGGAAPPRALIYGGGAGGSMLLSEARSNTAFRRSICGFVDDDPNKQGMSVNGVVVLGTGAQLPELVARRKVEEVLIAVPSADGNRMTNMVRNCQRAGVPFRTMPAIAEMREGGRKAALIRDVALEDILGRTIVEWDQTHITEKHRGKVVLVTGAAGSIGSEICRQVARFKPAALVALDTAESALFDLDQDMRHRFRGMAFHPEIGSVQNRQRLSEVFQRHSPTLVYHAAAYKHVPMMEAHAFEAVENNVLGTYNTAQVAAQYDAGDFVMISSDKAVRPTNIMGATKRVAELLIRSLQNGGTRYISVRFGNVLGSNGSVVPTFQKQIAAGGPVTVTHPDMQRYFMTIPEAAQLVLEASSMGKGGEIFVLDMGKPVRIVDLARQLILLSGLKPDRDIAISFTGVRAGEKLYEELNTADEHAVATPHQRIKVFNGAHLTTESASHHLAALRRACESRDLSALLIELKQIVPDYTVGEDLLKRALEPGLFRLAKCVNAEEAGAPVDNQVLARPGI